MRTTGSTASSNEVKSAKCAVCNSELYCRWTDTHGIGVCGTCGLPYVLYHYDEDKKRVKKPPSLAVDDAWLPLACAYWRETRERVFPGAYDMGSRSRGGRTYSGATQEQMEAFDVWMKAHKDQWPIKSAETLSGNVVDELRARRLLRNTAKAADDEYFRSGSRYPGQ